MSKENKVFYSVRLEKQPLEMLKMIAEVEYESTSCMVRRAINNFITNWHTEKKPILIEGRKGYDEVMKMFDGMRSNRLNNSGDNMSGDIQW